MWPTEPGVFILILHINFFLFPEQAWPLHFSEAESKAWETELHSNVTFLVG